LEEEMTIDFVPEHHKETKPRITVFGVGGAGGNAVNNMINGQLEGVEFVVANTDSQSLVQSLAERRVQLGINITHGLGAGARPDIGKVAAEEALDDIQRFLDGNNMVFIAAGMGGGTGTGAAPVIARAAREQGILTVGVVTKPFQFEGIQRMRLAELGIQELQQYVDTLIVIPNQNLFRIATENTTFADAFKMADDVLHAGVRGVTDLMVNPGLINLDFADIRTVMSEMGKAMMGTGEDDGETRATQAAEAAINNPLLDNASIEGARGVLINITGGSDMTLHEVDEAASRICQEVDSNANIIFGTSLDQELEGRIRVAVIATGIDADEMRAPLPEHSDKVHVLGFSERRGSAAGSAGPTASADSGPKETATTPEPEQSDVVAEEPEERLVASGGGGGDAVSVNPTPQPSAERTPEPTVPEHLAHIASPGREGTPTSAPSPTFTPPTQRSQTPAPTAKTPGFMPPPPVVPKKTAGSEAPAPSVPDPFREADMTNAAGASTGGNAKKPTLFERMTGTGRARREDLAPTEEREERPAEVSVPIKSSQPENAEPRLESLNRQSATPKMAAPTTNAMPRERADEDPLEIPAFLRRQAN
jgi:cell division protein FtsZ